MWWRCSSCTCPRRTLSGPWSSSCKTGSTRCTVGGWRVGPSACKSVHGPHWLLTVQNMSLGKGGGLPRSQGWQRPPRLSQPPSFTAIQRPCSLAMAILGVGTFRTRGPVIGHMTQDPSVPSASHTLCFLSSTEPHSGNMEKAAYPVGSPPPV